MYVVTIRPRGGQVIRVAGIFPSAWDAVDAGHDILGERQGSVGAIRG